MSTTHNQPAPTTPWYFRRSMCQQSVHMFISTDMNIPAISAVMLPSSFVIVSSVPYLSSRSTAFTFECIDATCKGAMPLKFWACTSAGFITRTLRSDSYVECRQSVDGTSPLDVSSGLRPQGEHGQYLHCHYRGSSPCHRGCARLYGLGSLPPRHQPRAGEGCSS